MKKFHHHPCVRCGATYADHDENGNCPGDKTTYTEGTGTLNVILASDVSTAQLDLLIRTIDSLVGVKEVELK
jgi:hypothetical protein